MAESRKKFLSTVTALIGLSGIAIFMGLVFSSNEPVDYAKENQFKVIAIDDLLVDKPKLFERDAIPVFAYISSSTGEPVILESYVKYDDSTSYRLVTYSPGVYPNGEPYVFVEPGKGGWFSIDGKMIPNLGLWYTGQLKPVGYEVRLSSIYIAR